MEVDSLCPVWKQAEEKVEHIFFDCAVSHSLWQMLLRMMGILRDVCCWENEVQIAIKMARQRSPLAKLYVMCFTEAVYALWGNRNVVVFRE